MTTTDPPSDRPTPDSARRVVDLIDSFGPLTQSELARRSGLSPAAVSNAVRRLRSDMTLATRSIVTNGRRATLVYREDDGGLLLGIDIGHRHARVAVSGSSLEVVAEVGEDLAAGHTAPGCLDVVARLVDVVLLEAGVSRVEVAHAGLGVPGPVDQATGTIGSFSILPGWAGTRDHRAEFESRLGVPVAIDNDANLGALGESVSGAAGAGESFVYVKASHGVGAGLIISGQVFHGPHGSAGEIGHMTIDENGPVCECGNRGCLQIYAGGAQVLRMLERTHGPMTLREAVTAARDGDPGCRRVVEDAGRRIGIGVATLCLVLGPTMVVIGGEMAAAGEILLDPLRHSVSRLAVAGAAQAKVVTSSLGDRAEVVGALALASAARRSAP